MIYLSFLLLISSVYAANNNCQFSKANFAANWTLTTNGLDIHFTYNNLGNNRPIDIDFGDDIYSQVSFKNANGQVMVTTGSDNGSGTFVSDSRSQATVQYATINGKVLNALVTLPLTFDGIDMTSCQTWNLFDIQDQHDTLVSVSNICPSKCT